MSGVLNNMNFGHRKRSTLEKREIRACFCEVRNGRGLPSEAQDRVARG